MTLLILIIRIMNEQTKREIILEKSFLFKLSHNWRSPLIFAINNCEGNKNNTIDHYFNFLEDNIYRGRNPGCDCRREIPKIGLCQKNSFNCFNITQIDKKKIEKWKGNKICTKTNQAFINYFSLIPYIHEKNCPSNTKYCGIIDSLNNILCLEKDQECPIIDINFNRNNNDISNGKIEIEKFSISTNNNPSLSNNKKIIVELKIGENQPCLNSFYENIRTNDVLDHYYERQKCFKHISNNTDNNPITYDKNFEKMDSYNAKLFLNENEIQIKSTNENINLYKQNYIGLKINCLRDIKNTEFLNKLTDYPQEYKNENSAYNFIVALMIFINMSLLIIIFNGNVFIFNFPFFIILIISSILLSQYTSFGDFFSKSLFDNTNIFMQKNCFDENISDILIKNFNPVEIEKSKINVLLVLSSFQVFLIALPAFILLLLCISQCINKNK